MTVQQGLYPTSQIITDGASRQQKIIKPKGRKTLTASAMLESLHATEVPATPQQKPPSPITGSEDAAETHQLKTYLDRSNRDGEDHPLLALQGMIESALFMLNRASRIKSKPSGQNCLNIILGFIQRAAVLVPTFSRVTGNRVQLNGVSARLEKAIEALRGVTADGPRVTLWKETREALEAANELLSAIIKADGLLEGVQS